MIKYTDSLRVHKIFWHELFQLTFNVSSKVITEMIQINSRVCTPTLHTNVIVCNNVKTWNYVSLTLHLHELVDIQRNIKCLNYNLEHFPVPLVPSFLPLPKCEQNK